jgi:hypothetical protein
VPRQPIREETIDEAITRVEAQGVPVARDALELPTHQPALSGIEIDGLGRVFAFANPDSFPELGEHGRPFEAFSRDGIRIAAGYAKVFNWQDSFEDFVYRIETSEDGEEQTVIRYRLVFEDLQK